MCLRMIFWFGVAVLAAGCAASDSTESELPYEQRLAQMGYRQVGPVDEVLTHMISGWEPIDKRHMLLRGGPGRAYAIAFSRPCRDLTFGSRIGYSATLGRLTPLDHITVSQSPGIPELCQIESLHRLERREKQ